MGESFCTCGHPENVHAFSLTENVGVEGHGPCAAPDCGCTRFTWADSPTAGGVDHFDWALCDPDAPVGTTYREGVGFDTFVEALRDLTALEAERTPDGFFPSGNVALYWSRKVRGDA